MWTESRGRLPTYLLVGASGLNVVHARSPFYNFTFFEKKWVQDMLTNGLMDLTFWTCFPEVHGFEIWTCFQEVRWFEVWTYLPVVWWIGILDVLPRGPKIEFWTCFPEVHGFKFGHASQRSDGLKFWRASQRPEGLESWMCFLEVQGLNFGRASQRTVDLNLDVLPRGPMD